MLAFSGIAPKSTSTGVVITDPILSEKDAKLPHISAKLNLFSPMSNNLPTVIITGGAGFIGSALCRCLVSGELANVINLRQDDLCGQFRVPQRDRITALSTPFEQGDICDRSRLDWLFEQYQPRWRPSPRRRVSCRPLDRRRS